MFKYAVDLFKKLKICIIPCIIAFVGIVGYCAKQIFTNINTTEVLYGERVVLEFSVVLFIFFLFISYEYFAKAQRDNFNECLSATRKGNVFRLCQFFLLELFALIFTVVLTLLAFAGAFKIQEVDWAYYFYAIKLNIIYLFATTTLAVLIGINLSKIKNNIFSYVLMILCAFMFSPLVLSIPGLVFSATGNVDIYPFFYMFEILPHDFSGYNYDAYGFPMNSHNYMLILFWLALVLGVLSLLVIKKNKILKSAITSVLLITVVMTGVFVNLPHSEYLPSKDDMIRGTCEGVFYYNESTPIEERPMQYNEPAGFNITSMDMDFKINRQLKATVCIGVDNESLDAYKFTLYRGYKIKNIFDANGNKLKYDRYSDYITVYPDNGNLMTDKICFDYEGFSPTYFSNSQGTYLPAGFAYYPINGFHYIFNIQTQGYLRTLLDNPVLINLNVDTKNEVFSNLEKVEENKFSGMSNGLTVVSGFYKETEIDGCRLIYKYIDEEFNMDSVRSDIFNTIKDNSDKLKGKTLIMNPRLTTNTEYSEYFEASDHMLFNSVSYLVDGYEYTQKSTVVMDLYYKMLTYYDMDSELYKFCEAYKNGELSDADKNSLDYILAQKIDEYGIDEIFKWLEMHLTEQFDCTVEELVSQIGEKTETDIMHEEYEKEIGLND